MLCWATRCSPPRRPSRPSCLRPRPPECPFRGRPASTSWQTTSATSALLLLLAACGSGSSDGGKVATRTVPTAADAVVFMVGQLRGGTNVERIREANDKLQFAEGEADKGMLQLMKELYQSPCDPRELVVLHDLYQMVEQAVDRCRNAGNIVVQIVLKHS